MSAIEPRWIRLLFRYLTLLAILIGAIATISYAIGAHIAVRYFNPEFGAWWNLHEFVILEIAAAALGLLIAIRVSTRMIGDADIRRRASAVSLLISLFVLTPLARSLGDLARMGFDGAGGPIRDWLIAREAYDVGVILDKVVIGGVYFLKITGFAIIAGLGIYALVALAMLTLQPHDSETAVVTDNPR